ncbi:DUF742 domain-containing protein [Actinacidiphila acidipaludis]|uniref:DUF742 domain-containing protein n=1 Tax=Actinacidiphila acidipaludis TaxID=2873382 RepID=A0ABS7QH73_9ACTN|nr:DUF742 domain-containing protein [Streptomyces acidipaludis]MBY8882518.1 DUF742 domain-containing protein [Streptomyces acidipaludis]
MTGRRTGRPLVPAYLSTGGVARPARACLERLTVLTGTGEPAPPALPAAQHALLDMLGDGSLTVVEAAALLELPVSAIRVLADELLGRGLILSRPPVPVAELPEPDLLKRVADGLRALKH